MPHRSCRLASLGAAVLLAACSPPPPVDAPPHAATAPASDPAAPAPVACNASTAQWAIGQTLDETLLERARVDAGARIARSLKPGQVVTMEFNAERLNVDVDDAGIVTGVRCG